jgi:transposase
MIKAKDQLELIKGYDFDATYRVEQNANIKIKLLALSLLQEGRSTSEVAAIVRYNSKTIKTWLDMFVEFDYEGLIDKNGRGRKPRLSKEDEELFIQRLDEIQESKEGGRITIHEIKELLVEEFDSCYSRSGVYALLDRLNIVWISGRSKHPNSSQEAIDNFTESFPEELEKIKDHLDHDKIEIWWQDESRIGQQGSLSRVWAKKGTRPRVVRQKQFLSTYIFGAVCPDRDVGCAMILPECSSGMMQIHLDQISKVIRKNYHAIVLMDRATWHTTEALNIPENLSLMPLPPYSPELNPMEQVWQQLRKIKLSNIVFTNYEAIVDACCDAWNTFCGDDGSIQKLCTRSWAKQQI